MDENAMDVVTAIACELARIDGYDPEDQHGGLYDIRWSGGPTPEPEGDAWNMDYLPKAERIAMAIKTNNPLACAAHDATAELEALSADQLRAAIDIIKRGLDSKITVGSPNLPDGPAWFALAEWDKVRKCYITLDPMYPHPKTNESAASPAPIPQHG